MKTSWGRSFKTPTGTTLAFIIAISGVTITECTPSSHRRRLKWEKDRLWFCFGRAAVDEVETFQQFYLEKRGAYWKAQIPILSQVRTQTSSHTECKMRPQHKKGSGTQKIQTKGRGGHYVRFRGDSSSHSWAPLWESKPTSSHIYSPRVIRVVYLGLLRDQTKPPHDGGGRLGSTIRCCNGSCSNL